ELASPVPAWTDPDVPAGPRVSTAHGRGEPHRGGRLLVETALRPAAEPYRPAAHCRAAGRVPDGPRRRPVRGGAVLRAAQAPRVRRRADELTADGAPRRAHSRSEPGDDSDDGATHLGAPRCGRHVPDRRARPALRDAAVRPRHRARPGPGDLRGPTGGR